jgi:hypothetical protein
VPVRSIEREFFSPQIQQSYGINDRCDVYQLLSCLGHHLSISNGMVCLLWYKQPKHTPLSVAGHQESNSSVSSTHEFLPSGYKNNSVSQCQSGALKEDVEHDGEISDTRTSYAHFAEAV